MGEKLSFLKEKKFSFRKIGVDKFLYCLLAGVALLMISIPVSSKKEADSSRKEADSLKKRSEEHTSELQSR